MKQWEYFCYAFSNCYEKHVSSSCLTSCVSCALLHNIIVQRSSEYRCVQGDGHLDSYSIHMDMISGEVKS